jgi:phospholipid/cholesterol/gamma-HCH transport system ATP-binding protein
MSTPSHTAPVIQFENVRLSFAGEAVLRGVSLAVRPRETKVLTGETGSGKTVLLKLAAGLLKPDAGRVFVLGEEISAMREQDLLDFRRRIGFVFQEGALFDSMSVRENVAFRLIEEGTPDDEIEARVHEALRFVEMDHAIDQLPGELSGGQRRRVSIARALISAPPVVLYDSPTAGLDPVTAQTIITLILRLRDLQSVSSLLATHRIQDAFALANFRFDPAAERVTSAKNGDAPPTSILVLREGEVYFEGDQATIAGTPDAYLKRFLV